MKNGDYVIVRTNSAGVFAGRLARKKGTEVTLHDARRIWYWSGAATLSQLAIDGTSDPSNCRFPAPVSEVVLLGVIEILAVTEKAKQSIAEVATWKA